MLIGGAIDKFKARLVIQGFRQREGIDYFDTYAPVVRISSIRFLIGLAAIHDLVIHQMDVKTAFLNGVLEEEVYMEQPEGFVVPGSEHKVCKLVKSLYGLKQAPKQWHQRFDEAVLSFGFKINQSDKCLYSKFDDSSNGVIICLYVDDMLIFGTNLRLVELTKEFLSSNFAMKDMGEADVILGIRIKRDNGRICLSQSHYVEKVLKKFNYLNCAPVSTPMEASVKLMPNTGKAVLQHEYSQVIGCLMYAMTSTRPDIAYAVGRLSRYTSNPSTHHWQAVKRVLKYLRGTMDYGLCYGGFPSVLEGYSDASWITNVEDHTSTSGWVFLLGGALEGSSHANYKRERSPTPNHPPFYCNAITRRSTTQVHEDNEEEEREYEEQLNDEDEEQSIDINASPKQSMDTPSPRDPRFSPRSQASTLPRLEAMQRPSPPTEEEDTWQYDPIDPNKISPMKLKEFNAKVKSLPFYVTFEEAWDKHGLVEFFFTTSENKEEIHQLFRKARFPIAPHGVNQPPSPPSSPPPQWYVNSISREKLAEFNQFVQTLPASMSFKEAWRHYPFTPFFHNCKETPEDIKELFEKAKVQPTFKTLYKIEDPGQFSIPCQVNGHYFDRTLCDSGSCINLMPTQTAKLLGITRLQPAQISIGLANHTIAKPRGVVVDVLLEIGDIKIPVDFHVINIQGGCDTPLILGRPFLATAGAVMDLPNRRMSLANVTRQSFTRPYHSSHQTSCLTSSLPKAAQESHQTTLKVTMRQELKDYVSGRALTPSPTKRSYQSS
ncbi:unnamed protein product [Microthlaspi erraticum]|uniref:Reverse transcriptase Ty1/copia-type domain-containing protein n=2 Tax=Microthlaspi erraticum TaxID=1685480 RepID=A0A6D2LN98_9BRAS|nr:unnamed protein product [Microthlaspi erraticum]